uniref:Matrix metalloproteinase-17 n=1 Tax=Gasterosteus aculeatus aculeatus TaxID=481459 RepID=G3Q0E3_GASAC
MLVMTLELSLSLCRPPPHPTTLQDWLSKFGYLPPPDPATGQLQTKEALTKAIKAMQKYGGLTETGVLDQATLGLMTTPRCSLPDVSEAEDTAGRKKRSPTPQNKWNKRHLSWRVRTFPKDSALLGRDTVRALMYYALKVWSDIAPLNFHEVAGSDADIQIDFTKADHNDGYPFDGPGGTVAHAFFPGEKFAAGDTHFDDDEAWTFRSPDSHGMDLFAVAVHEFGHAIGLVHTSAIESIMRPYYQGPIGDPLKYDLPYQDKVRVWQLYGVRDSVSHTNRPGDPSQTAEPPPVEIILNGADPPNCFLFLIGKYFWRLTREKHLVSLRPAEIHRFWRGLPPNLDGVDAVYERPGDHKIVFFKGLKYWVFKDTIVEEGYPRPISDFGLPLEGVDAAFVWLHNDKTYFFKDGHYWRYDDHLRRMDPGYPKDSTLWKGLPPQLDDAMRWSDGSSYFFKGKEYWRVPSSDMEAEAGYPRLVAKDWLLCTEMQSDSPDAEPKGTETRANVHRRPDHADNGYEVCSCTSDTASPLGARPSPSPLWLLPPLWTLSLALRSEPL